MLTRFNVKLVKVYDYNTVKKDKDTVYVFGDNLIEKGQTGQAVIRNLPNTVGIPVKRFACLKNDYCYFSDREEEFEIVSEKLNNLERYVNMGYKIALPATGIGTGIADLKNRSPKLFKYITNRLRKLHSEYLTHTSRD